MHLPCSRYTPPFISQGVERPGTGAGWEAGRRGRRVCAELRVSVSMCLSFTPPLSAATTAAAATAAAGIAAAPSLARRRYLLGQVRSSPGKAAGEPGSLRQPEPEPHRELPPVPVLALRKHVPAGAASFLSVGKPPLHPITITHTAYQFPGVKTRHLPHLAVPGDRERPGAGHEVGSGGCPSSRAWHRQM